MTSRFDDADRCGDSFVEDYLLYLLAAVSHRASAEFHTHVRQEGLRAPEWRVLACLYDDDGAMVTRLAQLALFEQTRLTKIIDHMADRGFVTRRDDPADRRRVRVFLTEHGRSVAKRLVRDARSHEADVLKGLDAADASQIKPLLGKLLARLGGGEPSKS